MSLERMTAKERLAAIRREARAEIAPVPPPMPVVATEADPLADVDRPYLPRDTSADTEIIAALVEPLRLGETTVAGYTRKEAAVLALFERLTVDEALGLHARLASPGPDDQVAAAFGRLAGDRRMRLVGYLADAPRRQVRHAARPRRTA